MKKNSSMKITSVYIIIVLIGSCQSIVEDEDTTYYDCSKIDEMNEIYKEYEKKSSLLFTYYSNLTSSEQVRTNLQVAEYFNDSYLLTIDHILPEDKMSYLKRRPPTICGHPARVTYHITVLSLDSIDEASMTYSLDIYLTVAWIDHRLRSTFSTRDYLILDPSWLGDLWQPDTIFKNAREVTFHERLVPNHYLWMLPGKGLVYVSKLTLLLTCGMSFASYPHDTQECDLKMESMSYTTKELLFNWDAERPISFTTRDKKIETPQFKSVLNKTENCTVPYLTGSYTCIRAIFYLRRRIGYHLIHTYFPSSLIVVLSWVTFWIKPRDVTARVGLGVTSLLTLATLSTQSQASLPPVSYGKAIDLWMTSCALFVFCSIIEFAIVNYLLSRFPEEPTNEIELSNVKTIREKVSVFFKPERIYKLTHNIDRISRVFFPTCFIILNVWYWNKVLQRDEINGEKILVN